MNVNTNAAIAHITSSVIGGHPYGVTSEAAEDWRIFPRVSLELCLILRRLEPERVIVQLSCELVSAKLWSLDLIGPNFLQINEVHAGQDGPIFWVSASIHWCWVKLACNWQRWQGQGSECQ